VTEPNPATSGPGERPPGAAATAFPDWYSTSHSALDTKMGVELLEVSPERIVARAPVAGNTQPLGLWHGGASCVLAETLGSIGATAHGLPEKVAVGVDINATHHRPVTSGWVTGTATAIRLGRTIASYEIVITDDAGRRVCTARITCQLIDRPADMPAS
jgi:1,4-dihydroxy-2-naphthoyl-CoA hydrolase